MDCMVCARDSPTRARPAAQAAAASGLLALLSSGAVDVQGAAVLVLVGASLAVADQVGTGGGVEALLLDSAARRLSSSYAARVATHEAGHFLVAYLLGLLPRSYTLSSWDAFQACVGGARPLVCPVGKLRAPAGSQSPGPAVGRGPPHSIRPRSQPRSSRRPPDPPRIFAGRAGWASRQGPRSATAPSSAR